jgi:hypothetical protein
MALSLKNIFSRNNGASDMKVGSVGKININDRCYDLGGRSLDVKGDIDDPESVHQQVIAQGGVEIPPTGWWCKRCKQDVDYDVKRCGCTESPSPWEPVWQS